MPKRNPQEVDFVHVMLDWAGAELLSPMQWTRYYSPLGEDLKDKVRNFGLDELDENEKQLLVQAVMRVRKPLMRHFRISPGSSFSIQSVSTDELKTFRVLSHFGVGDLPLSELESALRDSSTQDHGMFLANLENMLSLAVSGHLFPGWLVAVASERSRMPILIEGYKRALVTITHPTQSTVDIVLCNR